MTTLAATHSRSLAPSAERRGRVGAAVMLDWRLIRRGVGFIGLAVAAYLVVEVLVFRSAYSDAVARRQLLEMSSSTVVRMLQGVPDGVGTAGGFAVWDGGWMLMLIVGCWAVLTATRLARGEEDSGRAELVLSRPLTAWQTLAAHLVTLSGGAGAIALAAALPVVVLGEPITGAVVWGLGLGLLCATFSAASALLAQLVEPRRRATAVGLGLLAVTFVLRLVANSADRRAWLRTLTPFGWVEQLRAFSGDEWIWLLAPFTVSGLFAGAALALRARRDSGAAVVRASGTHRSGFRLLGSVPAFGWRLTAGALLGWTSALAVLAFVFGLMTTALIEFIEKNETYRRTLESMGVDVSVPAAGYLSYIAAYLGLSFAAFLGWRVGASWHEEAEGRLDSLLVRPVVRWQWLACTSVAAAAAGAILVATSTLFLWAGTRWSGAPVSAGQVIEPMAGTLPLVVLFTGIAVLTYGLVPRLTVTVPVTVAVLAYLLEAFGTALTWPAPLLAASPFHHLARLPAAPMTSTAAVTLSLVGVIAGALGVVAFTRRDLRGS